MNPLAALLRGPELVDAPGVYDAPTAALAVAAGHRAVHLSGAVCSALALGLPDLGYLHGTHVAERAAGLVPALGGTPGAAAGCRCSPTPTPATATSRTPSGPPARYAAAGIVRAAPGGPGQPKRCGHLAGKTAHRPAEAAAKIRAVAEAGTGLVVVARTDAYTVTGLADAIDRARAYVAAGADAVFVEGADTLDALAEVHAALPGVPLVVNRSEAGGDTAATPGRDDLAATGVRLVLHPVAGAAGRAARRRAGVRRDRPARARRRCAPADLAAVHRPRRPGRRTRPRRPLRPGDNPMTHVIVAGAGPVGLTAALALARKGVQVTVLEAGEGLAAESRASTFHPPTLEMLADLGVLDELMERGLVSPTFAYRDRQAGLIAELDLGLLAEDTPLPVPGAVRAVQAHPDPAGAPGRPPGARGPLRLADRRASARPTTVVTVTTADGRTSSADWVIGADGANSAVRRGLASAFDGITYPERFLVASTDEDLPALLPGIAAVNYVFDPVEWLVLLRTPDHWRVLLPDPARTPPTRWSWPGSTSGCAASPTPAAPGTSAHHALPGAPAGRRDRSGWAGCCSPATPRTSTTRSAAWA